MKRLDLIDWTLQEARQLSSGQLSPSKSEGLPSLAKLLEVLQGERVRPDLDDTDSNSPAATQALAPADVGFDRKSRLLKAIVEPDIYTAPEHRERAIVLRWVLRDIKSERLKRSPANQHHLQDLIDLGLVEMSKDAVVLTNAGNSAVN